MKSKDTDNAPVELLAAQNELEQHLSSTELGFEVVVAHKLEQRGIYDATRLASRKPEIYKACRICLMRGVSAKITAELLSLDIRTVNEVMAQLEAENAITPYKTRIVAQLRAVITLAVDSLMSRAASGELSAIDVAILIDKVELLSGGVTARVEHRASPEEEEALAFYEQLRKKATDAGMVFDAEVLPQTGALPEPAPTIGILSQQSPIKADQGPISPLDDATKPL
jgi:hypothetical protein